MRWAPAAVWIGAPHWVAGRALATAVLAVLIDRSWIKPPIPCRRSLRHEPDQRADIARRSLLDRSDDGDSTGATCRAAHRPPPTRFAAGSGPKRRRLPRAVHSESPASRRFKPSPPA